MDFSFLGSELNLSWQQRGQAELYDFDFVESDGIKKCDLSNATFAGVVADKRGNEYELLVSPRTDATNKIEVQFPDLAPGSYVYEIWVTNNEGVRIQMVHGHLGVLSSLMKYASVEKTLERKTVQVRMPGQAARKLLLTMLGSNASMAAASVAEGWARRAEEASEKVDNFLDSVEEQVDEVFEDKKKDFEDAFSKAKEEALKEVKDKQELLENLLNDMNTLKEQIEGVREEIRNNVFVDEETGHLWIGGMDTGVRVSAEDGKSPWVDEEGYLNYFDDESQTWQKRDIRGEDGFSPYISQNGFWVDRDPITGEIGETPYRAVGLDGIDGDSVVRHLIDSEEDLPKEGETCNGGHLYYVPKSSVKPEPKPEPEPEPEPEPQKFVSELGYSFVFINDEDGKLDASTFSIYSNVTDFNAKSDNARDIAHEFLKHIQQIGYIAAVLHGYESAGVYIVETSMYYANLSGKNLEDKVVLLGAGEEYEVKGARSESSIFMQTSSTSWIDGVESLTLWGKYTVKGGELKNIDLSCIRDFEDQRYNLNRFLDVFEQTEDGTEWIKKGRSKNSMIVQTSNVMQMHNVFEFDNIQLSGRALKLKIGYDENGITQYSTFTINGEGDDETYILNPDPYECGGIYDASIEIVAKVGEVEQPEPEPEPEPKPVESFFSQLGDSIVFEEAEDGSGLDSTVFKIHLFTNAVDYNIQGGTAYEMAKNFIEYLRSTREAQILKLHEYDGGRVYIVETGFTLEVKQTAPSARGSIKHVAQGTKCDVTGAKNRVLSEIPQNAYFFSTAHLLSTFGFSKLFFGTKGKISKFSIAGVNDLFSGDIKTYVEVSEQMETRGEFIVRGRSKNSVNTMDSELVWEFDDVQLEGGQLQLTLREEGTGNERLLENISLYTWDYDALCYTTNADHNKNVEIALPLFSMEIEVAGTAKALQTMSARGVMALAAPVVKDQFSIIFKPDAGVTNDELFSERFSFAVHDEKGNSISLSVGNVRGNDLAATGSSLVQQLAEQGIEASYSLKQLEGVDKPACTISSSVKIVASGHYTNDSSNFSVMFIGYQVEDGEELNEDGEDEGYWIYAWVEHAGDSSWVRVGEANDISSSRIYGLNKLGTDVIISNGAPVGVNKEGKMIVPVATVEELGVMRPSYTGSLMSAEASLIGFNEKGQLVGVRGSVQRYGAIKLSYEGNDVLPILGEDEIGRVGVAWGGVNKGGIYLVTASASGSLPAKAVLNVAVDSEHVLKIQLDPDSPLSVAKGSSLHAQGVVATEDYITLVCGNGVEVNSGALTIKQAGSSELGGVYIAASMGEKGKVPTTETITEYLDRLFAKKDETLTDANLEQKIKEEVALQFKEVDTKLASYVLSTSLTNTLKSYVTTTSLTSTLASYLTKTAADSAYMAKKGNVTGGIFVYSNRNQIPAASSQAADAIYMAP